MNTKADKRSDHISLSLLSLSVNREEVARMRSWALEVFTVGGDRDIEMKEIQSLMEKIIKKKNDKEVCCYLYTLNIYSTQTELMIVLVAI